MIYDLTGLWQADIGDGKIYPMHLPGTLDENKIGHPDRAKRQVHPDEAAAAPGSLEDEPIATRYTRKYTYEGPARLTRSLTFKLPLGKRIFLEAERARCLELYVDGRQVSDFRQPSLSTPHVFEVTGLLDGTHKLTLVSDNSYPGMPHDAICDSSAATDETQTNWNGVLGYLRLRWEEPVFIEAVRLYPKGSALTAKIDLCADSSWSGEVTVSSPALEETAARSVSVDAGRTEIVFSNLSLREDAERWDEYQGALQTFTAALSNGSTKEAVFGIRDFGVDVRRRLTLNGRRFFLRGEANCAVFPETGYCPMEVERWMEILQIYKDYGVNCMRFHSHCPPEAAFEAADRIGMLMQPEMSHWNPKDAFETDESFACYRAEFTEILWKLANHPSFVMLTFGNELHASEKGHERMRELLRMGKSLDGTRLYADASNPHYGWMGCEAENDFYTSTGYYEHKLRGTFANMDGYINQEYLGARADYEESIKKMRESCDKPVFSFEVGQFEILPDFEELEEFHGVTEPENLRLIRRRAWERGLEAVWKRYVEATGELSRIGYREEIEAAMRTEGLSGISLLGLQDFPGQGTALVGMLNSHLKPKPYRFARPEAFRAFFTDVLPLVLLPKHTYENTESLCARVKVANYGKKEIQGRLHCELVRAGDSFVRESRDLVYCPVGELTDVGAVEFSLDMVKKPERLELRVSVGEVRNEYPIWVYPPVEPVCPESVLETEYFDEKALNVLKEGGTVYLTPASAKEALPHSIQAQFTTDFWSVGTFSGQEGGMGQLIDVTHPIFREFPTEFHTNWQWWHMAGQRAVILPERYEAIITEMDSYAYLRPMAQLLECRCGGGKLLFSTMGLQHLKEYPEARTLLANIYRYLDSEEFKPGQEIAPEVVRGMIAHFV